MKVKKTAGLKALINDSLESKGVIVAHHGVAVEVEFDTGERGVIRVKRRSGHVVGDDVLVNSEVLTRLPRQTELRRRDVAGDIHLVGANLDVLGIVVAHMPGPPTGFIDRAVVAARAADLAPFLIINKSDLEGTEELSSVLRMVYAASLPIFSVSAATGKGMDGLREFFAKGCRGAFIGTTGVGKSSLLNSICPGVGLRVGALNYNEKGCHTTTVSTLHSLPDGGELIDTPGFQDFGLVDISAQDLASYFPGFEKAKKKACRFRDCLHNSEPGCAVGELLEEGAISEERYSSYLDILKETETVQAEELRRSWKN
ncbi:MAG TPA: ribosome small subunit-dependent GTPase A [Negativicutes bacterium]